MVQDHTDDDDESVQSDSYDDIGITSGNGLSQPTNARIQASKTFRLRGPMITLVIGPAHEAVSIQVHQDILTRTSEFFARALKPEWAAMRERPDHIELPAYTVKDVETYAHWLYSGKVPARCFDLCRTFHDQEENNPVWIDLATAYVFGEQILDRHYQQTVLNTMAGIQNDS
ncbi:hypothetical protein J4E90_001013 [Alternaria incomplexa]|nr:uncharacterized protein J4E90_001013 [Alternaria incomplexa]KAI4922582.1 hypothetical protein J4E90_001013 [Alternaria incomplexa]